MKKNIKISVYSAVALVVIFCVFSLGTYVGYSQRPEVSKLFSIANKDKGSKVQTTADFNAFWKVWNTINEKSIYATKVTDQERVWGAAQGLASSLGDPYTVFFPPKENKLFNDEIKGSFGGIGAEIGMKDKMLVIISPLKGTPAELAGIKAGDILVKIDGKTTADMSVDSSINLIRGPKGTAVTLTIFRTGEPKTRDIKITRDTINIPTIDSQMRPDGVFVIRLYSFSENSAKLFKGAMNTFASSGSRKLIIDLRGNPGGYLDAAVEIASAFLPQGTTIVSEDYGAKRKPDVFRSYGPGTYGKGYSIIVLIDGGSASASEILSGALQENGIAKLVGEQTFGKGSVQELIPITDTTSLKVTVARWLTPNGVSISEQGLTPDVKVSVTKEDIDAKRDPQLNRAVELLLAK